MSTARGPSPATVLFYRVPPVAPGWRGGSTTDATHENSFAFPRFSCSSCRSARARLHRSRRRELFCPARTGRRTMPSMHHPTPYVPWADTHLLRRCRGATPRPSAADFFLDGRHPDIGRVGSRGLSVVPAVVPGAGNRLVQCQPVLHARYHGIYRSTVASASSHRRLRRYVVQNPGADVGTGVGSHFPDLYLAPYHVVAKGASASTRTAKCGARAIAWVMPEMPVDTLARASRRETGSIDGPQWQHALQQR
jgi:hypothetical protein